MGTVVALAWRNLLLYFRDPLGVFFSLLGALIVFLLYTLFLGNLQLTSIGEAIPGASDTQLRGFVDAWMFAGIVALSTMTTPLGALGTFVEDAATGRFRDFLVAPIRRGQLVLGYLIAAFIVGVVMTLVVFLVALTYLWAAVGVTLEVAEIARSLGWIVLSVAGFASLWAFVVSFLRTSGAFSALSTIVGTVSGFVAGAYIAVGLFPDAVRQAVSSLPFAQSAMLLRREFTAQPLATLAGDGPAAEELRAYYGITLEVGDWSVSVAAAAAVLTLLAAVCTALAATRVRARIR